MEHVKHEQDILRRLEESRKAVKQKYNILKRDRASIDRYLTKTFKPVTTPLKKLVDLTVQNNKKEKGIDPEIKREVKSEEEEPLLNVEKKDEETLDESSIKPVKDELLSKSVSVDDDYDDEFSKTLVNDDDELLKTVIEREDYIPDKDLDKLFGVVQRSNGKFLGNTEVFINDDSIQVGKNVYPRTHGLLELMIKKEPNKYLITPNDYSAYREILDLTHVYRNKFEKDGKISKRSSDKLKNIIIPLVEGVDNKNGAGVSIPRFKVARAYPSITDYVYWDDPNELVDRLRLLIAENAAGNNAHINEIHSIIEELQEGGYIY